MPNNPTTPAQGEETIPCPTCDGQGRVLKNDGHDYPDAAPEMWYKDCPTCGGTGKVPAGLIGDFGIPTPQAGEPCTLLFCCSGKQPAGHNAPTPHQEPKKHKLPDPAPEVTRDYEEAVRKGMSTVDSPPPPLSKDACSSCGNVINDPGNPCKNHADAHQEPDTSKITSHPFASGFGNECAVCGRGKELHSTPQPSATGFQFVCGNCGKPPSSKSIPGGGLLLSCGTPGCEPNINIWHPFQSGSGNKCNLCGRPQALHPLQPEPEEWGKHIELGVTHFKGDDCDPANVEQPSATDPISKQPEIQTDSPALDPLIRDLIEMVARGGAVLDNPGAPGKDRNVIIRVGIIREMERVIAPFLASMKDEAVREAIRRTGEALKARYPLDQRDPYGIREAVNADMDEVVANTLAALPTIDAGDKDND